MGNINTVLFQSSFSGQRNGGRVCNPFIVYFHLENLFQLQIRKLKMQSAVANIKVYRSLQIVMFGERELKLIAIPFLSDFKYKLFKATASLKIKSSQWKIQT